MLRKSFYQNSGESVQERYKKCLESLTYSYSGQILLKFMSEAPQIYFQAVQMNEDVLI